MVEYSMTVDALQRNIQSVAARIAAAGDGVTLVAATKTVPAELVNAAIDFGVTDIGENRVQEYLEKRDAVKPAKSHFIGTLQRNKAKYIVGNIELIQSVNSIELAEEISRLATKRGVDQRVLIEVNAAGEATKTGASKAEFDAILRAAEGLPGITVCGMMSVPPKGASDEVYRELYAMYNANRGGAFDILSVGMSGDFEKAIGFGSNMVRIGSAIFGERQPITK